MVAEPSPRAPVRAEVVVDAPVGQQPPPLRDVLIGAAGGSDPAAVHLHRGVSGERPQPRPHRREQPGERRRAAQGADQRDPPQRPEPVVGHEERGADELRAERQQVGRAEDRDLRSVVASDVALGGRVPAEDGRRHATVAQPHVVERPFEDASPLPQRERQQHEDHHEDRQALPTPRPRAHERDEQGDHHEPPQHQRDEAANGAERRPPPGQAVEPVEQDGGEAVRRRCTEPAGAQQHPVGDRSARDAAHPRHAERRRALRDREQRTEREQRRPMPSPAQRHTHGRTGIGRLAPETTGRCEALAHWCTLTRCDALSPLQVHQ